MVSKAQLSLSPPSDRGWNVVYESFAGAFQADVAVSIDNVLKHPTVYACLTLIASDLGKMYLRLMEQQDSGIWVESTSPSFSPVLRKPNAFQTRQQFIESWGLSKLIHGNTYVLKARDNRGVVTNMYVLDPNRVQPLVAPDGSVFYGLNSDDLSRVPFDVEAIPASEIIHDRMECLFHPLIGISPLYACGLAATQGLKILSNSATFFDNMSRPSGILTAPGKISDETALRLKEHWEKNYRSGNIGKIAVLGDDLKYAPLSVNASDAQLSEQWKMSDEKICSAFHVPAYMVGVGPAPTYNNIEALAQQYYSQCLQKLIEAIEACLDDGLGLPYADRYLRTEFDLDDLLRMDSATKMKTEAEGVKAGIVAPNESRKRFNLPPLAGGDTAYLQQQYFALEALAKRDSGADPFATAQTPAPTPEPAKSIDLAQYAKEAADAARIASEASTAQVAEFVAKHEEEVKSHLTTLAEQIVVKLDASVAEMTAKFDAASDESTRIERENAAILSKALEVKAQEDEEEAFAALLIRRFNAEPACV